MEQLHLVTDEDEFEPASSNPKEPIIDLRSDYDEIAHVKDGILYRKGNIVQVWWDKWGKETWIGPSEEQARENFNTMKERWLSSELGNPGEPLHEPGPRSEMRRAMDKWLKPECEPILRQFVECQCGKPEG